jgi:predicted nuclease with RNAse H fold
MVPFPLVMIFCKSKNYDFDSTFVKDKNFDMMDFVGVDYGSKLAGTTAICFETEGGLRFKQSDKKQDADVMLLDFFEKHNPGKVFIDAPLSLPKAFFDDHADDYFYRKSDREVKAMSPMFLGGLTARAIQLANRPACKQIRFFEAYPRGLVNELSKTYPDLGLFYKSEIGKFTEKLLDIFQIGLKFHPKTWHQADAMLAYFVGVRHSKNQHRTYGEEDEGLIYI